jgi:uncharacterized integral membrane protein (TIGR00697 family)
LLTDVLNEFYGKRAARFITLVGFGLAVLSFSIIYIAASVPFASMTRAADWQGITEATFNNVFLGSLRMIVASMCAFLVSQFADISVFHLLKRVTSGKLLWLRATGSTAVSQLIDTIVITFVAWTGLMSTGKIIYLCHTLVERGLGIQPILVGGETPDDVAVAENAS